MSAHAPDAIDAATAERIAVEAYTYLYPLVTMDVTRRQMTSLPAGTRPGYGPMGGFSHIGAFPTADFKVVVRPNFDTLYSSAWLDLDDGPVILEVPDTAGRYYLLPIYDMWTDAFAVPGSRTSGTDSGRFALVGPGWVGELPDDVERIDCPTPVVWIIGRTQTNGPADYAAVHAIQAAYTLTPLAGGPPPPFEGDSTVDMTPPLDVVDGMSGNDFFALSADLLARHRPHVTDWSIVARMRRIGIEVGEPFDATAQPQVVRDAIEGAPSAALAILRARIATMGRPANGWSLNLDTMGVYGDFYAKRACIAIAGLGANQPEDAVYPLAVTDADGRAFDGANDYVLHFDAEQLPPADAFWSVTMYDAHGFQVGNELDRFAIGDRDALRFGDDGSLDLYIQHERPGEDRVSNWLPAPIGPLGITMRIYGPRPEVLDGRWVPPAIRRI